MRWCVYDPLLTEAQSFASHMSFGDNSRLVPRLDRADVVLALDSDFLDCGDGDLAAVRAFSSRRRVSAAKDTMNRLYVVENRFTLTGAMADHRLRCPASQISAFAFALAGKIAASHEGRRSVYDDRHAQGARGRGREIRRTVAHRSSQRPALETGREPGAGRVASAGRGAIPRLRHQFRAQEYRRHADHSRVCPKSRKRTAFSNWPGRLMPAGSSSSSFLAAIRFTMRRSGITQDRETRGPVDWPDAPEESARRCAPRSL